MKTLTCHNMRAILIMIPLLTLICFSAQGCGKKADPLCPPVVATAGISGLAVESRGGGAQVNWVVPAHAQSFDRVRIYRSSLNRRVGGCSRCPRAFVLLAEVDLGDTRFFNVGEGRYAYLDSTVEKGCRYTYRVSACKAAGRCDDLPEIVEIDF